MGKEGAEYFGDVLMKNTYLTDIVGCTLYLHVSCNYGIVWYIVIF